MGADFYIINMMKTHEQIDRRSLALARAVVDRIDTDRRYTGLDKARSLCHQWRAKSNNPTLEEWEFILQKPWPEVRRVLLDESETGCRLRQSNPFCGILSPRERWAVYREFKAHEKD